MAVAEWWRDQFGGQVRLNKSSYSLYARRGSASVSVLTVYTTGEAGGSVAPVAKTHKLADPDEAFARFQAAGFTGSADYPQRVFDPTIEEQRIRVQELLAWAYATVTAGNPVAVAITPAGSADGSLGPEENSSGVAPPDDDVDDPAGCSR